MSSGSLLRLRNSPQGGMPRSRHSLRYARLTELLVQARLDAGLNQVDLAARLRRPQSYVTKYENGERRLDVVEFIEAAEAIGCNAATMLTAVMATAS